MADYDSAPVATVEQFRKALLAVYDKCLPVSHLRMLKAQYRAPDVTITATQLANAAKYKSYHAANLQYGTLAYNVAQALGYTPATSPDGVLACWTTLSYSIADKGEPNAGHFQFIMRPELVEALGTMEWIKPLQNRVTPNSDIEATNSIGTMMGNRRKLHNKNKEIVVKWNGLRWIYCCLESGGIQREIMSPRSYTELFFLDEVTALSAGHRPCSSCMSGRAKDFRRIWLDANASFYSMPDTWLGSIDEVMHSERVDRDNTKFTYPAYASELPDGVYVELDGKYHVKWEGRLLEWSHGGYVSATAVPDRLVRVLTPRPIVRCIDKGFLWSGSIHDSAYKFS